MLDWLFRNRATGEYTIAQFPNASLGIFLLTFVLRIVVRHGTVHDVLSVVGTVALLWWSLDELFRGVNPWRRFLGAGMLLVVLASLLR